VRGAARRYRRRVLYDPLGLPLTRSLPYHSLLADLRRVVAEDEVHLCEGRRLLCERPLGADHPDPAWRGLEACELATCLRCKEVALRIVEGARAEADYTRQSAGPLTTLLVAQAEGDAAEVAAAADSCESATYAFFWLALLLGGVLALADPELGFLFAACGALCRLCWLALRPLLTRLD
jgi:hypothetical protein